MAGPENESILDSKELMFLVDKGYSQYQQVGIEIPKRQYGLVKTYLWAAVAIIGANVWYYKPLLGNIRKIETFSVFDLLMSLLGSASPILACIVFVIGVDTVRGRSPNSFPLGKLQTWKEYIEHPQTSANIFYTSLLEALSESIEDQKGPNEFRGRRLRIMSRLVIASAISGFICGLYQVFNAIKFI